MLMTNLQTETVEKIVSCYGTKNEVHFKAPTGSGKTLMAANVISKIINDNRTENFIFVIATISTSELPQAFETKINEYKNDLPCSDFEVEYIESPSSSPKNNSDSVPQIRIVKNKVYIFGKATFGKGKIYTEQNVIPDFINECKMQKYKIIYIRDEAHIGTSTKTKDKEVETFESLMNKNANFVLKMTATFDMKNTAIKRVELKENDLKDQSRNENKWLIKCNLQKISDESILDEDILKKAIKEFKEIQREYKTLPFQIKPAMLIQIDNEPTDVDKKIDFEKTLEMIKRKLSQNNLSWVQYFGDGDKKSSNVDNANFTLSKITRTNDPTDCIIFKIGPATGWDIPRACMLLQLRNVCSSNLNIQTIGRIKRNPYPNLAKNDITDKYYIFTNIQNKNSDYSVYDYKVKSQFASEELAVIKIDKKTSRTDNLNANKLSTELTCFLKNKKNEISVKINECFNNNIYVEKDKKLIIKNPILLMKRIKVLLDNLTAEQKKSINEIKNIYQKQFKGIQWEKLLLILLSSFIKDVTNTYKKCMSINVKYKIDLEKVNPQNYIEIFETNTKNSIITDNSSYLFDIKKDGQNTATQLLDSDNEEIVCDILKTSFQYVNVKVWCKNQTSPCNIYGEYLDELHDLSNPSRSYFDFVIKFSNGNYLYLEVKGYEDSDMDEKKTELLEKAYYEYFSSMNYGLFTQKLVICIVKVKDKNNIFPLPFYDKKIVENNLDGLPLEGILKELAK